MIVDIVIVLIVVVAFLAGINKWLRDPGLPNEVIEQLRAADKIMLELTLIDELNSTLPTNVRNHIIAYQKKYNGDK